MLFQPFDFVSSQPCKSLKNRMAFLFKNQIQKKIHPQKIVFYWKCFSSFITRPIMYFFLAFSLSLSLPLAIIFKCSCWLNSKVRFLKMFFLQALWCFTKGQPYKKGKLRDCCSLIVQAFQWMSMARNGIWRLRHTHTEKQERNTNSFGFENSWKIAFYNFEILSLLKAWHESENILGSVEYWRSFRCGY